VNRAAGARPFLIPVSVVLAWTPPCREPRGREPAAPAMLTFSSGLPSSTTRSCGSVALLMRYWNSIACDDTVSVCDAPQSPTGMFSKRADACQRGAHPSDRECPPDSSRTSLIVEEGSPTLPRTRIPKRAELYFGHVAYTSKAPFGASPSSMPASRGQSSIFRAIRELKRFPVILKHSLHA
jgi:hypothetical protein